MPYKNADDKRQWRREYNRKWWSHKKDAQGLKASRPCPEVCEVCGNPPGNGRRLDFDHCHSRNVFRGWLCNPCNMAAGCAKDDPKRLRRLADYIENFNLLQ